LTFLLSQDKPPHHPTRARIETDYLSGQSGLSLVDPDKIALPKTVLPSSMVAFFWRSLTIPG
jgi:hypothetical protein